MDENGARNCGELSLQSGVNEAVFIKLILRLITLISKWISKSKKNLKLFSPQFNFDYLNL